MPFIIEADIKIFYYRGLKKWQNERGYLRILVYPRRTGLRSIWTIFEYRMANKQIRPCAIQKRIAFLAISCSFVPLKYMISNVFAGVAHTSAIHPMTLLLLTH